MRVVIFDKHETALDAEIITHKGPAPDSLRLAIFDGGAGYSGNMYLDKQAATNLLTVLRDFLKQD